MAHTTAELTAAAAADQAGTLEPSKGIGWIVDCLITQHKLGGHVMS